MSKSGRYYVVDVATGRKFCVEPIGDPHTEWGDVDVVSKKLTGNYGDKEKGSIDEKESIIVPENNFINIGYSGVGVSPESYIDKFLGK